MRIRYRKQIKAKINPDEIEMEPGDLIIRYDKLYRLETPSGRNSRDAGLLYPRLIKPPKSNMKPTVENDQIFWVMSET